MVAEAVVVEEAVIVVEGAVAVVELAINLGMINNACGAAYYSIAQYV